MTSQSHCAAGPSDRSHLPCGYHRIPSSGAFCTRVLADNADHFSFCPIRGRPNSIRRNGSPPRGAWDTEPSEMRHEDQRHHYQHRLRTQDHMLALLALRLPTPLRLCNPYAEFGHHRGRFGRALHGVHDGALIR